MTLTLPADLEPYTTEYDTPAVYALNIQKPEDVAAEWDRRFETRPEWFDQLKAAREVIYVGATGNLISRLEDHRDGDVRRAVLPTLAQDVTLRNAWPCDDVAEAFEREWPTANRLRQHLSETTFVRQA